jgi:integrase
MCGSPCATLSSSRRRGRQAALGKEAARVTTRKGGAEPYTTVILPALEDELTRRLEGELAAGRGQADDFVCAMPRTGQLPHQRNLLKAVKLAALDAGLGDVTCQMLRRSFASIAARRIPDPAEASSLTGHSLDVWVRHYVGRFGPEAPRRGPRATPCRRPRNGPRARSALTLR